MPYAAHQPPTAASIPRAPVQPRAHPHVGRRRSARQYWRVARRTGPGRACGMVPSPRTRAASHDHGRALSLAAA